MHRLKNIKVHEKLMNVIKLYLFYSPKNNNINKFLSGLYRRAIHWCTSHIYVFIGNLFLLIFGRHVLTELSNILYRLF